MRKHPISSHFWNKPLHLLPAREVFEFLLWSSASKREQNSFFCILPLRYGIGLLIYQASLEQNIDQRYKVDLIHLMQRALKI